MKKFLKVVLISINLLLVLSATAYSEEIVSTKGFTIDNFAGNRSLEATLTLSNDMRYWQIHVNNTGNDYINVGTSYTTGVTAVPANSSMIIYNTSPWPSGNYTVTFVRGAGMYGDAQATISNDTYNSVN